MIKLINYLEMNFKSRSEVCTLIIEPKIPEVVKDRTFYRKPDALIIKDNVFCLIEMKGYQGNVIADCSRGAFWRRKDGTIIQRDRQNPFNQARFYRFLLLNYLTDNFSFNEHAPIWVRNDEDSKRRWPESNVHSWVITEEASQPEITGINLRDFPFFRVFPLDKLPQALMLLRSNPLLDKKENKRFIDSLQAKRVSKDEWYRSDLQDTIDQPMGLIPKITSWVDSEEEKNTLKAIHYIQELELKQHRHM